MIDKIDGLKQQIIYMYYYQGFTEKEIAKMLSLSQQRVNQIKKEALEQLKSIIK